MYRRFLALAIATLALALLPLPYQTGIAAADCGDVDGDGRVLASDALQILATVVDLHNCPPCYCDVDCNQEITVSDALTVLRVAVGFSDELGCCAADECSSTTTTTSTTITVPTTTTLPPQDLRCPASIELTAFARTGARCESDADCVVGVCDNSIGRCRTSSRLDYGYAGNAHGQDRNDGVKIRLKLSCHGPADPTCGECQVIGFDPSTGNCRCAGDNQVLCDEPFASDENDCGGGQCQCYNGPPIPSFPGGTPICTVERFVRPVSGRINVDDGSHELALEIKRIVYLGESLSVPCGFCDGDLVAGDGERDGTCGHGENKGLPCDVGAFHRTFPWRFFHASDNPGHSLDCFPLAGKNVSGTGTLTSYTQTTGAVEPVDRDVECGIVVPPDIDIPLQCHCGVCGTGLCASDGSISCATRLDCPLAEADECDQMAGMGATPCRNDADCSGPGSHKCIGSRGFTLLAQPHSCRDGGQGSGECVDLGDGLGECEVGPIEHFCDDVVSADGQGLRPCLSDADCFPLVIGIRAARCVFGGKRPCFADRVSATGTADAHEPVAASLFCAAPTSKASLNTVIGLPGLERRLTHYTATYSCAGDPTASYEPGVGGCP